MVIFYKKWKKYNETQLTKKKDLNIRKMTNHPPSPVGNKNLVNLQHPKKIHAEPKVRTLRTECKILYVDLRSFMCDGDSKSSNNDHVYCAC